MRRIKATSLVVILVLAATVLTLTIVGGKSPELGLDLQGGASVVLTPKKSTDHGRLVQAQEIIRNRVDGLGVAEPDIHTEGNNIVVQLPGVKNASRALSLVGQTAQLRFRPVLSTFPPGTTSSSTTATTAAGESTTATTVAGGSTTATTAGSTTATTAGASTATTAPGGSTTATTAAGSTTSTTKGEAAAQECQGQSDPGTEKADQPVVYPEKDSKTHQVVLCYELGPTAVPGNAVTDAQATIPNGQWEVDISLSGKGLQQINDIAAKCVAQDPVCPNNQFAIVLDGVVESAPTFETSNFTGKVTINNPNGFPQSEAKNLALVLRYGALPVELVPQTVQTVSATLGKDSLHAGLVAGAVGLGLVALYMILYYRALGIVVVFGMGVWAALNYAIITYLSAKSGLALSLAGVTGIIVSIGVTVDSYVVFFERLKDEIRSGKTIRSSVDRGFQKAFRTIITADVSSFMGALFLYWLTVGAVRGFAFFLGLSTILDVVVTWMFTRPLVSILTRSSFFTDAKFFGLARGLASTAPAPAVPAAAAAGGR